MIKGIIFDYGGTLDSRGVHWSEVLWQGYQQANVPVDKETFRTAYVEGERALARERIILPQDDFHELLRKKVALEISYLPLTVDESCRKEWVTRIADYCDDAARACIDEARPMLEELQQRFPMMLSGLSLLCIVGNYHSQVQQGNTFLVGSLHHSDTPIDIGRITVLRIIGGSNGKVGTGIKCLMTDEHTLSERLPGKMFRRRQTAVTEETALTIHDIRITVEYSGKLRLIYFLHNAANRVGNGQEITRIQETHIIAVE